MRIRKLLSPIYFLHYVAYLLSTSKTRCLIDEDVKAINDANHTHDSLLTCLAIYKFYRNVFYFRLQNKWWKMLLGLYAGEYQNFIIASNLKELGGGILLQHPYSTILNAKKIGKNFRCRQCTTIGNKVDGRNDLIPTIGDNVVVGANVVIIGDVTIGNNVDIGAGTVVVNNIPDNCVVVGNPAKIIKMK